MGRRKIKRGVGAQRVPSKDVWIADEIRYIQARAAARDARLVQFNSLGLFSTETGDAWLLDPEDHLASRLARDGVPEEVYFEEDETNFKIEWKGTYQIEGDVFLYVDRIGNRHIAISGYPTDRIANLKPLFE
uniref:Uncharacterized protein n=1 Tax=Solibacter usitatus (strain Ellin6076) TaxID=234267 RepID=Q028M9_SOLUE